MREIATIDGTPGAGLSTLAAAVAARLGWSVWDAPAPPPNGREPLVATGDVRDARWRFYLEAGTNPTDRNGASPAANPPALDPAVILIDPTGLTGALIAAAIAAIVNADRPAPFAAGV